MRRRFHEALQWGAEVEEQYAQHLASKGYIVAPLCRMFDVIPGTRAPMLLGPHGPLVSPDLFVAGKGQVDFREVKAKAEPTWRRYRPAGCRDWRGPRWEHGVDYANFRDYEAASRHSKLPVWLVVWEELSPLDAHNDSPLEGPSCFLWIHLQMARSFGDRRRDWPGGRADPSDRGRDGKGGWLWPRAAMHSAREGLRADMSYNGDLFEATA